MTYVGPYSTIMLSTISLHNQNMSTNQNHNIKLLLQLRDAKTHPNTISYVMFDYVRLSDSDYLSIT